MKTKIRTLVTAGASLSALVLLHCSSSSSGGFEELGHEASTPPPFTAPDAAPTPDCPSHCSHDLKEVLDCKGALLERCGDALACGGPTCVSACEATKANRTSIGCEYVVPRSLNSVVGCSAIFVTNMWSEPATVEIAYDGEKLDVAGKMRNAADKTPFVDGKIPAGGTAVIGLSGSWCNDVEPLKPDTNENYRTVGISTTARTPAFTVASNVPVQIHSLDPYNDWRGRAGTLLAATSAWATDYVVSEPNGFSSSWNFTAWIQIVAQADGTVFEIVPKSRILGSDTIAGAESDQRRAYILDRGQVLQFRQRGDLTGSVIHANAPVAVYAGSPNPAIPANSYTFDAAQAQLTPVQMLGHRYATARHRDRYADKVEKSIWRIVGAVGKTELKYEPAALEGAPSTLEQGEYVEFASDAPFVVTSQDAEHPFALFQYMTGPEAYMDPASPVEDRRGSPEFVPVVPSDQYLRTYTFPVDPSFPELHLVAIRQKGTNGFAEVKLDCVGPLTGWSPVGSSGEFEVARIDLSKGNFEVQGTCGARVHTMRSNEPFTATLWGWGSASTGTGVTLADGGVDGAWTQAVSFGYPVGAGFRPINHVSYVHVE